MVQAAAQAEPIKGCGQQQREIEGPRLNKRAVVLGRVKAEPFGWPLKSGQP
jgi:hypothetical protein